MFCENDLRCIGFVFQYASNVCAVVDSFTGDCTEDPAHMTGFLNRYECSNNHNCENSFVEFADINLQHGVGQRKRYCGSSKPPVFSSLGSYATITTQHDGSGRNPTFQARVRAPVCSRDLEDPSGVIISHFGGGYYPPNLNCRIRIMGEQGSKMAVFFSFFDLECSDSCRNDKLVIANKVTHCCKDLPVPFFYSGSMVELAFTTDGNEIVGEGFKADYTCNHSGCGGKISGYNGYLYPFDWPRMYDSNQNCEWQISSADDTSMYVKIEELNIYPNGTDKDSSCFDDEYLQIFEASPQDPHKKSMLKTCGVGAQPPVTIYARYGPRALATIVFRTGNRSRSEIEGDWNGFKINWYQKE